MFDNQTIVFSSPGVAQLQDSTRKKLNEHDVLVKLEVSTISSGTEMRS